MNSLDKTRRYGFFMFISVAVVALIAVQTFHWTRRSEGPEYWVTNIEVTNLKEAFEFTALLASFCGESVYIITQGIKGGSGGQLLVPLRIPVYITQGEINLGLEAYKKK